MRRTQSEWEESIKTAINKLELGVKLEEDDLGALACQTGRTNLDDVEFVTLIRGHTYRGKCDMATVIKAHGRYWRIDWLLMKRDIHFKHQPVEVRPVTRTIPTHDVTEYEAICDSE